MTSSHSRSLDYKQTLTPSLPIPSKVLKAMALAQKDDAKVLADMQRLLSIEGTVKLVNFQPPMKVPNKKHNGGKVCG